MIADYGELRPITDLQSPICNPDNPGGPGEIRTLDLLSAIEARSQLRYRPVYRRGVFYLRQGWMSRKGFRKVFCSFPAGLEFPFHSHNCNNIHKILTIRRKPRSKTVLFFQISPKNRQNAPFFYIVFPLFFLFLVSFMGICFFPFPDTCPKLPEKRPKSAQKLY